ncbi:MAG: tRNA (adenosine(37)-N6)-threonylcarbamoyltransferase complex ATPase subunit type 1 TsaE [Patescibacteria group bacterium]
MGLKSKTYITYSPEETKKLAQKLLQDGARIFLLTGQLGTGKSTFVRGLAQAVGWKGEVPSPTFTLMKEYPVTAKQYKKQFDLLMHVDLYRLEDEPNPLPLDEWVEYSRRLLAVEWPKQQWRIPGSVEINFTVLPDQSRQIEVIPLA